MSLPTDAVPTTGGYGLFQIKQGLSLLSDKDNTDTYMSISSPHSEQ